MSSRCVDVVCAHATEVMDNERAALFPHPKPQSWRNQGGTLEGERTKSFMFYMGRRQKQNSRRMEGLNLSDSANQT